MEGLCMGRRAERMNKNEEHIKTNRTKTFQE